AQIIEQLEHHLSVTQPRKRQATIGKGRFLAQGDDRLSDATQFLRLGQRCLDDLVPQQRIGHVAQHGKSMAAGAVEFSQSQLVTHVFIPSNLLETDRRPVLQFHAKRESARGKYFLDLVERFAAKVRRLQQLRFRTLDQVADVVDVFRLEAVRRAHGEFEVINRAQKDRIDL